MTTNQALTIILLCFFSALKIFFSTQILRLALNDAEVTLSSGFIIKPRLNNLIY